ncbi:MAG: 6-hydroxymethylpterin diphosphokinase MptE-like protein [Spirochaetia bacterium]
MSLLEDNIRVLSTLHPHAAEAVGKASTEPSNIDILATLSGEPTARQDGVYLHGRHDPARDAAGQVRRELDSTCTAVIVVGFGLGYGAEAARQVLPAQPLLVVEPDAGMFRAALTCRDLRRFLEDPAVHLHVGANPELLPAVLETLPLVRPGFLRLRSSLHSRPGLYRASEETIHSWLLRRDINVNTLNRFGRLWVRNLCRNMGEFLRCPGVASLHGIFDGLPALVVAGGPSLDGIAPRLTELRERMLVVSVNTPLRACREHGVEPDFTTVVDPQYWASRSLDWTPACSGVFVAEPSTCPRVFRAEGGRFFLCSSLFPLGETLEIAVGEKGKLGAGGSVSTSAWDLARLLGARPLYAAGLDLGYPGMRTHCRGAYPQGMWLSLADRLSPLESSSFRALRDIGLFSVPSTGGGTTPTDRRMMLYKWWFENQLRMHPDLPSYTMSTEGIAIDGMPLARLEDALELPVVRPEIDRRMSKVRQIHEAEAGSGEARESLVGAIAELGSQLSELEALALRGRARSRELGALIADHRDAAACIADMDEIDHGILALSARSIAGFLIQSVIHGIIGEGDRRADPRDVVTRSESMYEGIADSAAWQRGLLQRASAMLARFP